ncbi:MAG TPA: DUF4340 domain-containing protein [Thermoanaerobaculia bacterium]|nr:DUF4340 domain-containing protein [Thermoanaerobaculia bacterium]
MSTKKLLILTGIFFALFAFVFFFERHQPTSEERAAAKKRLLDFKAEAVTALVLERPDLPRVDLRKGAGGRWTIAADPPGRADAFAADALVSDLSRLELVGEPQASFDPKEYGLDAPRGKATLVFADGSKKTVSFGKEIPGTDGTAASDGSRLGAVRAAPLAALAKPVNEYRSKRLLDTPVSEISKVILVKGPNRIVLARETGDSKKAPGPWRIESPVADTANGAFVERLLADLSSAQISDYPSVSATDLPRVGLAPPAAVVTVQKGEAVVATLALGAAKADTVGKIYAKDDALVVVVDDRIQEEVGKELSAFRETRLLPLDVFRVRRLQFESGDLRAGAERTEGEWRSGGRPVAASLAENLLGELSRAESRGFVAKKDYGARGIAAGPRVTPLATVEVLDENDPSPDTVRFYAAAAGGGPALVAAEVSGRPDALLLESAILEDLRREAGRLRDASKETPTAGPIEKSKDKPKDVPKETPKVNRKAGTPPSPVKPGSRKPATSSGAVPSG